MGAADNLKVDQYEWHQEIELRLNNTVDNACQLDIPASSITPEDRTEHIRLMLDLMVMAFQCDLTRVSTFMMGNAGDNRGYTELGIAEGHHELSHHQNDDATLEKLRQIDVHNISHWKYCFLDKMESITIGDRALLDETTLFMSSECSDGNGHWHFDLPVVLAGRAGALEMEVAMST